MKKIILVLGLLFCIQMQATIITFPDANFKSVLIGTSSTSYTAKDSAGNPLVIDANGDNEIEDTEALNVYTLYIGAAGITDATGLEYFTNIEDLDIDHNSLTNMNDILWALQNLKFLNLGYNQIVYIDLNLHPTIEVVSLYNNSLTFFRMTQCPNLKSIDVYQNLISTFDFGSNPLLENVEFSYNNVSYISAFDLPSLKTIQGVHNNLSNFMLFDVPVIETINLRWNQFTSFPSISGDFSSLKELYLSNNPNLTSIALTGLVNLRTLHCNSGQLAMLDASNLPNLTHLECNNNLLTSLILTGSPVSYLDASNNLLGGSGIVWRTNSSNSVSSSLSISNISSLTYFDCSDNQLTSLNLVGANSLGYFDSRNNPSLATIFVDDVAVANANTSWFKDAATTYVAASSPPVANDDQKTVCYVYPRLDNFDITINDVDANGNPVDASTVDLDPSTPEQDTSFTVNGATFYVDNFGKLFVLSDLYGNNQLSYTVKDFSGTTSNIATINLYMQIDITVEDEDFSATPINGTVGGITISVLDNDYGSFGTSSNLNAFDFTFNSYFSINSLGFITVNPGTPAGVYIFTYEVKEFSLDTQFCPGRLGQATILVLGAPPTANFDGIIVCSQPGNLISYPLTANDLDANSNPVDATTVDLDPSTPEQDTSITVNSLTFSVDSSGVLTTNMPGLGNYGFFYTVKDSNGTLSNIANVSLYFQPNVLVTNDDFSATPINGATGGVTSSVLDNDFVVGGSMIPLTAQDNFYNLGSSFTISSTGYITIPAGTPVGVYTFNYEVKLAESATAYCPGRMSQATIVVTGGTPPTANSDLPVVCPNVFGGASYGLLNYNVVANDYDSSSNPVDASTVDLDPSTSGQQTSVMVSGATFSVNAFGDVTSDIGLIGSHTIFYTVKDMAGIESNVASINVYFDRPYFPNDDILTDTPIDGVIGGISPSVLMNDGFLNAYTSVVLINTSGMPFTVTSSGEIIVPAGTLPGVYIVYYELRNIGSPCPNNPAFATILVTGATYYADNDGDGFGNPIGATVNTPTTGYVLDNTDCNDSSALAHPGLTEALYDGIDNNCDGQLDEGFQITAVMQNCGATLSSIGSLISTVSTAGINGYRFEITDLTNSNPVQTIDKTTHYFSLTELTSYNYSSTYSVRVMLRKTSTNTWLGYYGPACSFSTPAVSSPTGGVGSTQLQAYCGQTIPSLSTLLTTTSLPGVVGYRFRVTNTITGTVETLDRTLQWFSLTMLTSYNYGTTYSIDVAVRTSATFPTNPVFGAPCLITTPMVPMLTSHCGTIVPTKSTLITTASLSKVTNYRFEVTRYDATGLVVVSTSIVDKSTNKFSLNDISNYAPNTIYSVRVALMTSGSWSPFGNPCFITSPAMLRSNEPEKAIELFDVIAYPNPFNNHFEISLQSSDNSKVSVLVYDMVGRLIEDKNVNANEVSTIELGTNYPTGVYNVIVSQSNNQRSFRMIKR